MFDLFRSRAKAVRYLLGFLLLLVAISMVVTLIPGWGTQGDPSEQIVAEIGDTALTLREVQFEVQRELRNRSFPAEMAATQLPQIVERMITDRALAYQASRMGYRVTEADLSDTIRAAIPQLFPDGKFVGREAYASVLAQQNLTIPEFEATLRRQMLMMKLSHLAAEGVVVSPAEVEAEFKRRNEKVKLEYIALSRETYLPQVSVTREEILSDYQRNKTLFNVPEKRSLSMLVVDEAEVSKQFSMPEADLRKIYESNLDNFRLPERVRVRHILLKTTDRPQSEIPALRAKAEDLLKQIRAGADFAELARKNSEDTTTAVKGGDLDWVVRGQTVKAFEDSAFSLKPKQLSNVITTEYGLHILEVLEKQEARLKPFEEVKPQLATEVKRQAVYELMQRVADQAHDELAKSPQQAREIAGRLGVAFHNVEKLGYGDPIPVLGASQEFFESIATLKPGEVTPVIQGGGNKLVVAALTEVHPARQAELGEVEKDIRERLTAEMAVEMLDKQAKEAFAKAKASGGDLKRLAQVLKVELKTTQEFAADGAADGIGSASEVSQAFLLPTGEVFLVSLSERRLICKATSRTPADPSQLAAQREALVAALKSRKQRQRADLFEDSLRAGLMREGKLKINEDVIKRLIAGYRG
jgi:peptidyl-prolyl cis-trans isomerase D